MVNKVLAAYVAADLAFVATGATLVGFSVIVQNLMFNAPTNGTEAVQNLLYQQFPLTGMQHEHHHGRSSITGCSKIFKET